jgi:hypothetical protein
MSSTPDRSCSSLSQDSSYSSNASASSSSRYSLDSPSSCGSSSTQADTARVKKPAYKFLGVLNQECPNYAQCQGEIEVWKNLRKDEVFVQCSGDVRDCRYSTKIATYSTCCVCGVGICQGNLITQHEMYTRWVHLPCRTAEAAEANLLICLICRKPIMEGEATKHLNRGGKHGVRHQSCGQAISACPYVVDLTEPLQHEDLPAARNEDLFPSEGNTTSGRGRKRSAPSSLADAGALDHDGTTSPRDPRVRRA